MVVSSTSMNVGMTTAAATIHGLTATRRAVVGARATVLMVRTPGLSPSPFRGRGEGTRDGRGLASGFRGADRRRGHRLQHGAGVGAGGRFLGVDARLDRQADEQGGLIRVVVSQLNADRQALHTLNE